MRTKIRLGLIAWAVANPVVVFLFQLPEWAWGIALGESIGGLNFLWISFTVKKYLFKATPGINRKFAWHSLARFAVMVLVLVIAIKSQWMSVWGIMIGYSFFQISAAIVHTLHN